jgi:hypothetical protein
MSDTDLDAFMPAFNGHGNLRIEKIDLNGSKVSLDAVHRFRQAVPDCEVKL